MTTDPVRAEDTAENMAWGDNFLEINGVWYSERGTTHTRWMENFSKISMLI